MAYDTPLAPNLTSADLTHLKEDLVAYHALHALLFQRLVQADSASV